MPTETTTSNTETTKDKMDLKSAITSAVESTSDDGQEKAVPEKAEETPKEAPKGKTKEEEEEEKAEAEEAQKLYKALKNPETRGVVVDFLIKQSGYEPSDIETKQDVKEVKSDLISSLKESLGDEFAFLADKIAPGLEKYLNGILAKSQADIRASLDQQEKEKLEMQSARAIGKLTEDFFGEGSELPQNVQTEMSKFMDKVPPSGDLSIKEYVELAFTSAIGKLGLHKVDKKKQEKIEKNRSDASSRLASDRSSRTGEAVVDTSKPMNRRAAIQAAIEAAGKES